MPRPLAGREKDPAGTYLEGLAPGSRRTMADALEKIARRSSGGRWVRGVHGWRVEGGFGARELAWAKLDAGDVKEIRAELVSKLAPATVNKALAGLRGVLRVCWSLGLMDSDSYQRATDVKRVRAKRVLLRGRALEPRELRALVAACRKNPSRATGMRDVAAIAVLYAGGLRRAEAVALDIEDYDRRSGALRVRHGKGDRERVVYLGPGGNRAIDAWLEERGREPGALLSRGGL